METVMPMTNQVNTNTSIIQYGLSAKTSGLNTEQIRFQPLATAISDLVEISKLATEKQQQATQLNASKQIEEVATDVVKISTTIGKARSSNNLTNSQAIELYQKIAKLL
ncbi:MAG: hypothetical protein ACJAXJ_000206 [Colwellia sp.]|jgi:hypothetical protein